MYRKRQITETLLKYIKIFPVVGLTGPRQSGKSTLLLHTLKKKYRYVSFDNHQIIKQFYDDPVGFMATYHNHVIFDEAQKIPELFNDIKIAVDNDRQNYGKFILTGSSQFMLLKKITESLAGRIGLLSLLPFQFSEFPKLAQDKATYSGSYPELVNRNYQYSGPWYESYIETYLEKDVRGLSNIGNLKDFRRLLSLLAANASQVLNYSTLANDIGISIPTVKQWISILEASYIVFLLPPYYKNYGKRITKSAKLYFYDTGLVAFLTGIKNKELFEKGPMAGSLFKNYIIAEIKKQQAHFKTMNELFYYRTNHGVEIDLIVDKKNQKEVIEIKRTSTFRPKMIKALATILEANDKAYLLYNGPVFLNSKAEVINYKDYLKAQPSNAID